MTFTGFLASLRATTLGLNDALLLRGTLPARIWRWGRRWGSICVGFVHLLGVFVVLLFVFVREFTGAAARFHCAFACTANWAACNGALGFAGAIGSAAAALLLLWLFWPCPVEGDVELIPRLVVFHSHTLRVDGTFEIAAEAYSQLRNDRIRAGTLLRALVCIQPASHSHLVSVDATLQNGPTESLERILLDPPVVE